MDVKDVLGLFGPPFTELVYRAAGVHRALRSVRNPALHPAFGEDGRLPRGLRLLPAVEALCHRRRPGDPASRACSGVARPRKRTERRFCMGAAWRGPKDRDLEVAVFIGGGKALGLETCVTLGMLKPGQAERLRERGSTTTTTTWTLAAVLRQDHQHAHLPRPAGDARACAPPASSCGGIVGMGELREDRAALIAQLASLEPHPGVFQFACCGGRDALAREKNRSARIRAHHSGGAHLHAQGLGAALRRARKHCPRRCRRCASSRSELRVLWGEALDPEPGNPQGPRALRAPGP